MFAYSGTLAEAWLNGELDKHIRRSYMTLIEKIKHDQLQARKAKSADTIPLLTTLLGEANTIAKNQGHEAPTDIEVQDLIRKFLKGNAEVLDKAPNEESVRIARIERAILEGYLPQQLSPEQLASAVKGAIDQGNTNIGAVMGFLKKNFAGLYDGKAAKTEIEKQLA